MFLQTLPTKLQRLLSSANQITDVSGRSPAKTYRLVGPETFFLKVEPVAPFDGLKPEVDALRWLRERLPAPEVLFYERTGGTDYLLMRSLSGLPASDVVWKADPKRLATTLGEALRRLHNLDPLTCPFDQRTNVKLHDASESVRLGLVEPGDFDDDNAGRPPEMILEQLYAEQPAHDDLVVVHGDFCLDNLLLHNWALSGFIDVGSLGVGDRYQDLALGLRELVSELETNAYNAIFLLAYGLTTIDEHKLHYFRLLDELQ